MLLALCSIILERVLMSICIQELGAKMLTASCILMELREEGCCLVGSL